jgi:outer membrane usher protein
VTVKESDGSEQSFVVPFASLAILQREGQIDYALSSGKTLGELRRKEYNFLQSNLAWGHRATSRCIAVFSSWKKIQ